MKAILGCYTRPYLSSGIQTETFIVYHLSEYLREASQRIEHEAGCRHTYALPSELQNWIIHQKPTRRRIGDGIAAPRGSSCGGGWHIYIYTHTCMQACMHACKSPNCVCMSDACHRFKSTSDPRVPSSKTTLQVATKWEMVG